MTCVFRFILLVVCLATPLAHAQAVATDADVYRSVLRIEVATQIPDYSTPWNTGRFSGGIGTGFLIGKNRILTNAHVVSNARRVLITVHGSPKKYPARVAFIAHDCDLALLEVDDFTDFTAFPVFELGEVPVLESQVRVIGYPIGGERLSVTRGVVSRIDFQAYSHSRADSHLVIQIDAAINPGNSGGPVVQNGKVVGVAFQGLRQADNTGYIIPTPVIRRFLKDIEDGTYDHYADLGIAEFALHNPAMRKALKLANNDTGILVTNVIPQGTCDGALMVGDVLLAIDGQEVDSAGMVLLDGEKVNFHEVVERKFAGDMIDLRFLRNGAEQEARVELKTLKWSRMYAIQYEKNPRFMVFAGLVFQPLDMNLFATEKFQDITLRRIFSDYVPKGVFLERQDVVVLTRVERDPINSQLADFTGYAVDQINGEKIASLKHAYELLHSPNPPEFHVINLLGNDRPLVIPSSEVVTANERIAENYGISRMSNLED